MFIDYGEINEIVQQTIEVMLYNLEAIPYETADNYAYWTMRNVCLNFFYHHRKRYCCAGEFDQYEGIADIDYIPQEMIASKNSSELKIRLTNGSLIQLAGSDDIDRLVGTNPSMCECLHRALC